jgi:hypothetical protein
MGIGGKDVFIQEDANDMIDVVMIDRKTAVPFFEKDLSGLLDGCIFRDAGHIDAGDHNFTDVSFFEISHGKNQFSFLRIEMGREF